MDLVPMLGPVRDLGEFIRDQRQSAQLSLRGLAAKAGISNPYLSQVERGLRRPSAEILAQIATGLSISVESMLARAGVLPQHLTPVGPAVVTAIGDDRALSRGQKAALIEIYSAFVAEHTEHTEHIEHGKHAEPAASDVTTASAPEDPPTTKSVARKGD